MSVKLCPYREQCDQYDGGKTCHMKIECGLRNNFEPEDKGLIWPKEDKE